MHGNNTSVFPSSSNTALGKWCHVLILLVTCNTEVLLLTIRLIQTLIPIYLFIN